MVQNRASSSSLVVIIPGVTIPFGDVVYMIFAIFLSGIVHELGHSLASAAESVQLEEIGFNFFLILPSAYVAINFDDQRNRTRNARFGIFTAGVWHNLLLVIISYLILILFFYPTNSAIVTNLNQNIPGVGIGDVIVSLNGQKIEGNWIDSLRNAQNNQKNGFCLLKSDLGPSSDCCDPKSTSNDICVDSSQKKFCVSPKIINFSNLCPCDDKTHICGIPHDRLFRISTNFKDQVHYYGSAASLYQAISTTNTKIVYSIDFTLVMEKILNYTISISLALAVLNILPVFYLDGEQVMNLFETPDNKDLFYKIKVAFSVILCLNLGLGFILNIV